VADVVDHDGRVGTAFAAAVVATAAAAVRRTAASTAVSCVSGVGGDGAADGTSARRCQIAYAAAPGAAPAEVVGALLLLQRRAVSARGRRRPVQRFQFGGHAVVDNVETHRGQRHAGQYVHGTEPHGGRAGERHLQRPRVTVPDGAEQHETEEHAVQVSAAAAVQPVQHGRAAADVRRHEREPDQQQRHETGAVRCGRGRHLSRRRVRGRRRGRRGRDRHGRRPVGHPLEHVVRVAGSHVVRFERVSRERFHAHVVLFPFSLQLHPPLFLLHQLLVVATVPALGAQTTAQRPATTHVPVHVQWRIYIKTIYGCGGGVIMTK